ALQQVESRLLALEARHGHDSSARRPGAALPADLPGELEGQVAAAQAQLRSGAAAVARAILEHALSSHPDATEGPRLRFLIGETWAEEQRWGKAASIFHLVGESAPGTEWAARALVRQAECFQAMGDVETARLLFAEV